MSETRKDPTHHDVRVRRWMDFFRRDLWRDTARLSRPRRTLYRTLQVLALVAERFMTSKVLLQASALTYSTVLSIVPLLAFMFALLKGLGVQDRLEPIILARVSAGSQEMVSRLVDYIDRVNVGSLGVLGLAFLVTTIVFVLGNIESAFNDIWGVKTQRTLQRKFSDYLSLTLVTPIFLLVALSVTASLKSSLLVQWLKTLPMTGNLILVLLRLVPYLALWFAMTFLFMFMPNTRVRFKPALIAGILTGTAWQVTQWGYVTFQVGVSKYNAIYGTFAQVPIMLVWIYISWVIVLFGAEFTYAFQNLGAYRQERRCGELTAYAQAELALAFLRDIERHFRKGKSAWTAKGLSQRHGVSLRQVQSIVEKLARLGYLTPVAREHGLEYVPSRSFDTLPVAEVLERLEAAASAPGLPGAGPADADEDVFYRRRRPEQALLRRAWQARRDALSEYALDRRDAHNEEE